MDSMPETAENVAVEFKIEREAQDLMAMNSQLRAVAAQKAGHFAREIVPVVIPQKRATRSLLIQMNTPVQQA